MAKDDMSWLDQFKPSQKSVMRFLRGQQSQFNPIISNLLNQYRLSKGPSDTTKMYEEMLKGLPSKESISSEYKNRLSNLSSYIQNLDTAKGGRAVSDIVSGLGSALGVEGAGDVASAAGTVSGVGGLGGDVINKALLMGAEASFGGLKAQRLSEMADRTMGLETALAEARQADKAGRRELGMALAQARSQKRGAMMNPLELYSTLLGIRGQEKALRGGGGGGYTASDDDGGEEPPWWKKYGFTKKPYLSKNDMKNMWNMSTGYGDE